MKTFLLAAAFAFAALVGPASAHGYKIGSLEIGHPWARATPKGATVAGGYLTITNRGTEPDRLVGGTISAAERFEIHEMSMDKGVMKMRPLAAGIEIAPGATVELKPGGYHLMFIGIKTPFVKDQRIKGTLRFEKAGTVDVEYAVTAIGGSPSQHEHGQGHGGSHGHGGGADPRAGH